MTIIEFSISSKGFLLRDNFVFRKCTFSKITLQYWQRKRMNMNAFTKILLVFLISDIISLKIYKSNVELSNVKLIAGLTYKKDIKQNICLSSDFTICIRAKLRRLAYDDSAMLLLIENSKNTRFLKLFARYPATWFKFGNPNLLSWILRDTWRNSYLIWKIEKWNHICFSYSDSNAYINFVKVS